MFNLDFDTARAEIWKREVDEALAGVSDLLMKVSEVCSEVAGEDDTLMNSIYVSGTKLQEEWTKLGNVFRDVQEHCSSIIKTVVESGERGIETIEQFRNKYGVQ